MKPTILVMLVFLLISISSCKKELPHYPISDDMKQFFAYQKGSYWIYQNDSTMMLDSTYVWLYQSADHDNFYSGKTREIITMYFKSQFLSDFEIWYFCPGPNCLTIASKILPSNDTLQQEIQGPIAYFAGWEPNTTVFSQKCLSGCVFTFSHISKETIDNYVFYEIIRSRMISIDSSALNPYFYFREIHFARNIGIIKYVEIIKYLDIYRSFSIKRFKVIQ